jgi:hypothetical protein
MRSQQIQHEGEAAWQQKRKSANPVLGIIALDLQDATPAGVFIIAVAIPVSSATRFNGSTEALA